MPNINDQEMLSLKTKKVEATGHIDDQDLLKTIPEDVQNLRTFDGKPTKLIGWMADVDLIIESLSQCEDTPEYQDALSAIRSKIVGIANVFLTDKNTVLSWKCIKEDLILHFMKNNDLMVLNTKLNRLRKKQQSIEEYYEKFVNIQKIIKCSLQLDPKYKDNQDCFIKLYDNIALDVFIRKIGLPLCILLRARKPINLLDAYNFAINFQKSKKKYSNFIMTTLPPRQL